MNFEKNDLLNETLDKYFETWQHTQDTADFVDEKYLKKIDRYIFKNLKKQFSRIDVYSLLIQRDNGVKLGIFNKIRILLSSATPIYEAEKREQERLKFEAEKRPRKSRKRSDDTSK